MELKTNSYVCYFSDGIRKRNKLIIDVDLIDFVLLFDWRLKSLRFLN